MATVVGKYPGVFPTITDLSQVVRATSTSVIAAVGEARKGSIFKRRLITSASQMASVYGQPDLKYGYMEHCMVCAFEESGEAYLVRVVADDSKYAALKVPSEGKTVPKFVEGYTLTEVDNSADESFFYKYEMEPDGTYKLDQSGNRIPVLDEFGNPVVDTETLFAVVGENPNEEDIRVRLTETTVIPSNKRATSTNCKAVPDEDGTVRYIATVSTGNIDNDLKEGDRVIITDCPISTYNGTFSVLSAQNGDVVSYPVTNGEATFYVEDLISDYASEVQTLYGNTVGWARNAAGERRFVFKETIPGYEEAEFDGRSVYVVPEGRVIEDLVTDEHFSVVIRGQEYEEGEWVADPDPYFVPGSSLEIGAPVYRIPDTRTEPVGTYNTDEYRVLSDIPHRFMKPGVEYFSRVTDGVAGIAESGQFYFTEKDLQFLKAGEILYTTSDLQTPLEFEGISDETGAVFDGAASLRTDSATGLVVKHQYVRSGTRLYSDAVRMTLVAIAQEGVYTFESVEPVVNTSYSFSYRLLSEPLDLHPQIGLRWVKSPDNSERKFDLSVFEVSNGVYNLLESFNDCTLYSGSDGFGNQTKVSIKVNENSEYIRIIMNESALSGEVKFPLMVSNTTGKLVGGYCSSAISSNDLSKGWDLFADTEQVTVNVLLHCGYTFGEGTPVEQKMLSIATQRRDCFAVLDVPSNVTQASPNTKVQDYRKNILGIDSYRAGLYTPWVEVYDSYSGVSNVAIPMSGFVGQVIARNDNQAGVWCAPAGLNRGQMICSTLSPVGLTQYYNESEQGSVYENGINYARKTSGIYVIWGQKTLQFKASAMDRINVARLVFYIETTLKNAAKWHLFELNTAYRRAQITMQFESFLEGIKASGGLYAYKVVCDETNNDDETRANNQMNIDIYIQPEYAAEFIRLQTVVQKAGATVGIM